MENKFCLCDDLVTAILTRLPIKSLIRFTCVSKSWNSVIHSPTFIEAHNKFQTEQGRYRRLYIVGPSMFDSSAFLTFWDESLVWRSNYLPFNNGRVVGSCQARVVGSCQGLVCVIFPKAQLCLWNPILQTFKILPTSPASEQPKNYWVREFDKAVVGLGYSCKHKDYRLVKITYYTNSPNVVEIYSLQSNSWKSIDSAAPYLLAFGSRDMRGTISDSVFINGHTRGFIDSVFINGRINWYAPQDPDAIYPIIMWFDIDNERFGKPKELSSSLLENLQTPEIPSNREFRSMENIRRSMTPQQWKEYDETSSWDLKMAACRKLYVQNQMKELRMVKSFEGDLQLLTWHENLVNPGGLSNNVNWKHWEKEELTMQMIDIHALCLSESLVLLDHQKCNQFNHEIWYEASRGD